MAKCCAGEQRNAERAERAERERADAHKSHGTKNFFGTTALSHVVSGAQVCPAARALFSMNIGLFSGKMEYGGIWWVIKFLFHRLPSAGKGTATVTGGSSTQIWLR